MTFRVARLLTALIAGGLVMTACQEQLTAPGSCPATCPGGTPVLRDTVLDAIVGADSLFSGYITRGVTGAGLRVSNGLGGDTNFAVIRFIARGDSLKVRDTSRTFTVDSVAIELTLLARDTTASGVWLALHRLPATVDTTATYGSIAPLIVPGTLIDTVTIADSVRPAFKYRFLFTGDTLALVSIPPADSGVLAVGLAIGGGPVTGVRIGGIVAFNGAPVFRSYVTVNIPDTVASLKFQTISRGTDFTTFVAAVGSAAPDSTVLAIGAAEGVRALIRFPWPAYLRDSALLARATLELVPAQPINGLPGDSAFIQATGARVDFGAKSPLAGPGPSKPLIFGSQDTVRIDAIGEIQLWQGDRLPHPPMLFLRVIPEGASFTEPRFYSTRDSVAARRPRLRITYQIPFDFERP